MLVDNHTLSLSSPQKRREKENVCSFKTTISTLFGLSQNDELKRLLENFQKEEEEEEEEEEKERERERER